MAKYPGVSVSVTKRLPRYYRFLGELADRGVERISSRELAELLGLTASQIRQDLNCFGGFGQQGYGYNVGALRAEIARILSLDKKLPAILLGAGNLGLALANHMRFDRRGFELIGIFDNDPEKIGLTVNNWQILDISGLEIFCREHNPKAAILCIPKEAAVEHADNLVKWGVAGFWNFSHQDLSTIYQKDRVAVENVHLGDSLMALSYYINEL